MSADISSGGVLSPADLAATADSIVAMQESSGAIPWTPGEHADIWNHVEAAMALVATGRVEAAEAAYRWAFETQRLDGSWPLRIVAGRVDDDSGETNMSAYLAVGIWQHWLIRRDIDFARETWPAVRAGLNFVVGLQLPFGGIAWSQEWHEGRPGPVNADALLAGSASIYTALEAGLALAELVGEPQPHWLAAKLRLGVALRERADGFLDKSTFSMDWYYPVLGGAVRGAAGHALLASRWDEFVVPGLGVRCVSTNPWVTGAETCELALALDALGDTERAQQLFADMQHLRDSDGAYWTGYVYDDDTFWPVERTTYTAAAVILADDALAGRTPASGLFRSLGRPVGLLVQ